MALQVYTCAPRERTYDSKSLNEANSFLDLDEDPIVFAQTKEGNSIVPLSSFDELGNNVNLQMGVYDLFKSKRPSRTEALLLSTILSKRSVFAQARKSSDKDFSIVAGLISRIDLALRAPQVIYLAPTQAVVEQIHGIITKMGCYVGLTTAIFAGRIETQEQLCSQVILGTIDSLPDWIQKNNLDTRHICILVIDELDYYLLSRDASQRLESVVPLKGLVDRCKAQTIVFYSAIGDCLKQVMPMVVDFGTCSEFFGNKEEREFYVARQMKVVLDYGTKADVVKNIVIDLVKEGPDPRAQVIIYVDEKTDPRDLEEKLGDWTIRIPSLAREENKARCLAEFMAHQAMILITSQGFPLGYDVSTTYVVIFHDLPMNDGGAPRFDLYHHLVSKATKNPNGAGYAICILKEESEMNCMSAIEKNFDVHVNEVGKWKPDVIVVDAFENASVNDDDVDDP